MKQCIAAVLLTVFTGLAFAADFVHPMDFAGSDEQKQQVIEYIEQRVRTDYCESQLDMCQPTTLRMMEQENLKSFKRLTSAKNRPVMNQVISTYCSGMLDMCNYTTIEMMYDENNKASKDKLSW